MTIKNVILVCLHKGACALMKNRHGCNQEVLKLGGMPIFARTSLRPGGIGKV